MTTRWKVECWNCDEGTVEGVNEWDGAQCRVCWGNGYLIVTELTDENCETAIPMDDGLPAADTAMRH